MFYYVCFLDLKTLGLNFLVFRVKILILHFEGFDWVHFGLLHRALKQVQLRTRRRSWWTRKHRQRRTPRVARVPVFASGWSIGLIGAKICQDDTNYPSRGGKSHGLPVRLWVKRNWLSFNMYNMLLFQMTNLWFFLLAPIVSARL